MKRTRLIGIVGISILVALLVLTILHIIPEWGYVIYALGIGGVILAIGLSAMSEISKHTKHTE
jgi:predicted tellurium resistance membrane protein TerC